MLTCKVSTVNIQHTNNAFYSEKHEILNILRWIMRAHFFVSHFWAIHCIFCKEYGCWFGCYVLKERQNETEVLCQHIRFYALQFTGKLGKKNQCHHSRGATEGKRSFVLFTIFALMQKSTFCAVGLLLCSWAYVGNGIERARSHKKAKMSIEILLIEEWQQKQQYQRQQINWNCYFTTNSNFMMCMCGRSACTFTRKHTHKHCWSTPYS